MSKTKDELLLLIMWIARYYGRSISAKMALKLFHDWEAAQKPEEKP